MSDLVPFAFEGSSVRVVVGDDGAPWFVAKDVAIVLELDTAAVGRTVEADDRGLHTVQTPSGAQQMVTVNESGLYCMIFKSRKPAAKKFKRWVTAEVLPLIRKTGGYGQAVDLRELTKALSALGRYDRNAGLDLMRKTLPTIPVGRFQVTVLPIHPPPSERAAAVLAVLQQDSVPWHERAAAYVELVEGGYTPAEIASITGRNLRHVQIDLKMWRELSPAALDLMREGRMRLDHAKALIGLPHAAQDLAAKLIVRQVQGWRTHREIRGSLRRQRSIAAIPTQ